MRLRRAGVHTARPCKLVAACACAARETEWREVCLAFESALRSTSAHGHAFVAHFMGVLAFALGMWVVCLDSLIRHANGQSEGSATGRQATGCWGCYMHHMTAYNDMLYQHICTAARVAVVVKVQLKLQG